MDHSLNNYADFAENDYIFFKQAYANGNLGSPLAALGQSICERYLKHIVSEYSCPENEKEQMKKENTTINPLPVDPVGGDLDEEDLDL